ncbi:MAG TPA: hypothetical protein ENJ95_20345 [Bacteroidetes bacterium]|nr:hypothetical protein [Bacteroidota bacterium]
MQITQQTYHSIKRIGFAAGVLLLALLITAAVERKKELPVGATIVNVQPLEGNNWLIDSTDVIKIIERSFGMPLNDQAAGLIDEDRVERILEEDPFVKNAEVTLTANSLVKINIEQRKPILRVIDNLGAQYYLDGFGKRMPLSDHFTARTLVATGDIMPHTPDFLERRSHEMKALFALTNFIIADPFWKAMFEQIYVNKRGEFVLIPKIGDQTIIFGKYEDVENKFYRLKTFYKKAMGQEGWKKFHSIDLRFKGQVVCEKN